MFKIGRFWIKTSKSAIFEHFIQKWPILMFLFKNVKNCNFWCFYQKMQFLMFLLKTSKMTDLGVPPIGHFWIKMSKNVKKCQKMQFLIFLSKKCNFWCFYQKCQKMSKKWPIGGTPNRAFLNKNVKKCQKMQFLMFLSKNAIFDVFIKKCNFWRFYQKMQFLIFLSKNGRFGGTPNRS